MKLKHHVKCKVHLLAIIVHLIVACKAHDSTHFCFALTRITWAVIPNSAVTMLLLISII